MGRMEFDLFATLDLIAQAPGGPEVDTVGGFKLGRLQAQFSHDDVGDLIIADMASMHTLLLGRKTYDIFARNWPLQEDDLGSGIAGTFSRIPKHLASRGRLNFDRAGSS